MKKIIILDNKRAKTYVFPYDENIWESGEQFLRDIDYDYEFSKEHCNWMIVPGEIIFI